MAADDCPAFKLLCTLIAVFPSSDCSWALVLTGKGNALSLVENGGGLLSSLDAARHFHFFFS
jgi:hypothetical protein